MAILISTNTIREGILTMDDHEMTILSDQTIQVGDSINSPLHVNRDTRQHVNLMVDEILEERKSRGDWKTEPPTWRRLKYHRA